jgi:hypothetical protein
MSGYALLLVFISYGQTEIFPPYNPDADSDSVIAILDLMSVLSIYGDEFIPNQIMVETTSLQEYINGLQEIANSTNGDTVFVPSVIPGNYNGQILFWNGVGWDLLDSGMPNEILQLGYDSLPNWVPVPTDGCKVGCQDVNACNFDSTATVTFDGACDYISCTGCMDPMFMEFDANAVFDDGTCETLVVGGCMDLSFIEYNPSATIDDGTCLTLRVFGCMDSTYLEFNPEANDDNGSCQIIAVPGCLDSAYMEFSPNANSDDGSCEVLIVYGCTDAEYLEYLPEANTDDDSCQERIVFGCTTEGYAEYCSAANVDDGSCLQLIGCMNEAACNFDPDATAAAECLLPGISGDCESCELSLALNVESLEGGQAVTQQFSATSGFTLGELEIVLDFSGAVDESWVSDMMFVLCSPDSFCLEIGGYDISFGADVDLAWPQEWNVVNPGTYYHTIDLSEYEISGVGEWSWSIVNGWQQSVGVSYAGEIKLSNADCELIPVASSVQVQESFDTFDLGPLDTLGISSMIPWDENSSLGEIVGWQSYSPSQSLQIYQADAVFPFSADSAITEVSFRIRISSLGAYYNFQESSVPGVGWPLSFYYYQNGTIYVQNDAGGDSFQLSNGYTANQWMHLSHFIDSDAGLVTFYIDGNFIQEFDINSSIGGLNFYSGGDLLGQYLVDDVIVKATSAACVLVE